MNNIIEKHISKTEKRFKKYLSIILKSKYDKEIAEELIQAYIDARYYNFDVDNSIKFFYRRIYNSLILKSNDIFQKNKTKKSTIENTLILFQYLFYFDYVRENIDTKKVIELIAEKRITRFNLRLSENDEFIKELSALVNDDMKQTQKMLELYDNSDEFEIELKRVDTNNVNFFFTKLLYHIEFPKLFSLEAIQEVFDTDIIAEDRLFVEYPMVANIALKDILVGNFNRIYIVDFAVSLFGKSKKLEQLLDIIDNQAAQDKIYFSVRYDEFGDNKEKIYNLMKKGFKFALIANENMKTLSNDELKLLDVFACIIANKEDVNIKKYKKDKLLLCN